MTAIHAEGPIGFLHPCHPGYGYVVLCHDCTDPGRTPVYSVNILPYSQHCAGCDAVLVEGQDGWPELFELQRVLSHGDSYSLRNVGDWARRSVHPPGSATGRLS